MSLSVEIHLCSKDRNPNCKPTTEVKRFLQSYYFTMYTMQSLVEFTAKNLLQNPLKTTLSFHSQFMVNTEEYRDNNNFMRINKVSTNDHRLLPIVNNY